MTVIVTMQDVRAARLCSSGSRAWCRKNGVSWPDFVANGLPAETLRAFGDPVVERAVVAAEERVRGQG